MSRISKLEEEHNQALELSANRGALVRKELEALKEETDKLKYVSCQPFLIAFKLMFGSL